MSRFARDFHHSFWLLIKSPGFTATVVLTLALGIGASTAVFSVVKGALIDLWPYEGADRIVTTRGEFPKLGAHDYDLWSVAEFQDLRQRTDIFDHVIAGIGRRANLAAGRYPKVDVVKFRQPLANGEEHANRTFDGFVPAAIERAYQEATNPLLGAWSGRVHYGSESKQIGFRYEVNEKNSTVAYIDIPELQFHNLGPFPVQEQSGEYAVDMNAYHKFRFRSAVNMHNLKGVWLFDGHELPFELAPELLRSEPATQPLGGRVAQPVWSFKTDGEIWSSPVVANHLVYFGSNDGNIYAVRVDSGKPLWHFKTGHRVMGAPTLDDQYLYAPSDDGYLYKIQRKTGNLVWKFDTHGKSSDRDMARRYDSMASAATVAEGTVYIGSADKNLYAIDAQSGHERWHFETRDIVRSTPAIADGLVFIGSMDHNIYAVDSKTGTLKWKYDTLRDVVSSPLVSNGTVYIGSRSSDLFALDADTGSLKWKYFYWSSWVESSARIRDGIVYIGSSDLQQLFAIDAATGKELWRTTTDGSSWSTPAVTGKRVYIGAVGVLHYFIKHHGAFLAIDRATGKVVWRYPMSVNPGSDIYGVASSPAVDNGLVLFGGLDGTFYAFRTDD